MKLAKLTAALVAAGLALPLDDFVTDEDKAAYEMAFYDPVTDVLPPNIDSAALNRWLFNAYRSM